MFTKAFLEETGNGKLRHEEQLLLAEFQQRGIPVMLYSAKRIQRRQLPLSTETFMAGDMDAMHGAMRQLNIEIPTPNDYPVSLSSVFHRKIWQSTLGALEQHFLEGDSQPVFAKPAGSRKSFTGRVFSSLDDFREIGRVSRRQDIWCSEEVTWLSEYRVYVMAGRIVSVDLYAGDSSSSLDLPTVEAALKLFQASGEAPSAYGIDFGVLSTGQTALIEANDGYALGAYKIGGRAYTDLLLTRWAELVSAHVSKPCGTGIG